MMKSLSGVVYRLLTATSALMLSGHLAHAVVTIEIDQGIQSGIPIAVVPFANASDVQPDEPVSQTIENDLIRTGRFAPLAQDSFLSMPNTLEQVKFNDWRLVKVDYLVVGTLRTAEDGRLNLRFQLLDVFDESQVAAMQYTVRPRQLRAAVHLIANEIFGKLIGAKSSFDSRIAYCASERIDGQIVHSLVVSDYDGNNPQTIFRDTQPIISPSWSPDSSQIAYSVLEQGRAKIYVQTVETGVRRVVAEFNGENRSPSWSPDGSRLAFTLSTNGNSEIYVLSLLDGLLTRITDNLAIDTESSWSPDSENLVFTSGRSGKAQIYITRADGSSAPRRLTFEGDYNAGAKFSPDGKRLVLITNQGNGSQVGLFDIKDNYTLVISKSNIDDSPNFSPHGDMVIYIREGRDRQLIILSPNGAVQSQIPVSGGSVRQVAWEIRN